VARLFCAAAEDEGRVRRAGVAARRRLAGGAARLRRASGPAGPQPPAVWPVCNVQLIMWRELFSRLAASLAEDVFPGQPLMASPASRQHQDCHPTAQHGSLRGSPHHVKCVTSTEAVFEWSAEAVVTHGVVAFQHGACWRYFEDIYSSSTGSDLTRFWLLSRLGRRHRPATRLICVPTVSEGT
jgi:hypothetical protein